MEGLDLSSWRLAFNGAEPVNPDTMDRFTAKFVPCGLPGKAMTPVYGLAEATLGGGVHPRRAGAADRRGSMPRPSHAAGRAAPLPGGTTADGPSVAEPPAEGRQVGGSHVGGPAGRARRFVSCGPPIPGFEVRIVDDRGTELEERAEGAVEFRGPSTTSGYFRNPAANHALFDGEWLRSGDRGYVAGGELYVTGRDKDLIVRAGRNLYPYDLEAAVGGIEGVRKGCVAVFASRIRWPGPSGWWWSRRHGRRIPNASAGSRKRSCARRRRSSARARTRSSSRRRTACSRPPAGRSGGSRSASLFESGALKRGAGSVRMQVARLALAAARGTVRSWARRAARAAYTVYAGVVAAVTFGLAWLVVVMAPGSARARWRRGRAPLPGRVPGLGHPHPGERLSEPGKGEGGTWSSRTTRAISTARCSSRRSRRRSAIS